MIGIVAAGDPSSPSTADLLASFAVAVVAAGGSVVAPAVGPTPAALAAAGIVAERPRPTVRFAERPATGGGLHLMAAPTGHVDEIVGGLVAAGAELIVAFSPSRPMHAHPFVPVLQVTDGADAAGFDLVIDTAGSPEDAGRRLAELAAAALAGDYTPAQVQSGAVAFQLTRGTAGVSL